MNNSINFNCHDNTINYLVMNYSIHIALVNIRYELFQIFLLFVHISIASCTLYAQACLHGYFDVRTHQHVEASTVKTFSLCPLPVNQAHLPSFFYRELIYPHLA